MSMGHFLDLNAQALGLFRLPLALAAASLFLGPLASLPPAQARAAPRCNARPRRRSLRISARRAPRPADLRPGPQLRATRRSHRAAGSPGRPHRHPPGVRVRHDARLLPPAPELRLRRPRRPARNSRRRARRTTPAEIAASDLHPVAVNPIHILTDAELQRHRPTTAAARTSGTAASSPTRRASSKPRNRSPPKWPGPQRIFLWQDLAGEPSPLPASLSPVYVIAKSGGKEIVSNQQNRP